MAERDAAPAGRARNPSPGALRVTVRWHYDWLPFSGLDATARAGRNPRARGSEEDVRPSRGSYGPGATSPAVERREAGIPIARDAPRLEADRWRRLRTLVCGVDWLDASWRSAPLTLGETRNEGEPGAFQTMRAAKLCFLTIESNGTCASAANSSHAPSTRGRVEQASRERETAIAATGRAVASRCR